MESVADLEVIKIKQNEFKYSFTWKSCFGTSIILKRLPLNLVFYFIFYKKRPSYTCWSLFHLFAIAILQTILSSEVVQPSDSQN